jgi:hypothetical protein
MLEIRRQETEERIRGFKGSRGRAGRLEIEDRKEKRECRMLKRRRELQYSKFPGFLFNSLGFKITIYNGADKDVGTGKGF